MDLTKETKKFKRRFIWGLLAIPACIIAVVFPVAHFIVPAGSPWVGMALSPPVSLIVEIFFIIHFWGLAKAFPDPHKSEMKRLVKSSILWGPPLLFIALFGGGMIVLPVFFAIFGQ